MSITRSATGVARRLGGLVLAVGLLAALWIGTVNGVERGSRAADERRAADRSSVAAGFASSVREWVDAGRREATTFSRSAGSTASAQGAIEAFFAQPKTFARSALVFAGTTVTAASADHAVLVGLHPKPCTRRDETGHAIADTRLMELVRAATRGSDPVVSQIFDVPGDCRPAVGIAVASGSVALVVLGDPADAAARIAAGSLITDKAPATVPSAAKAPVPPGGTSVLLITGNLALEPRLGIVTVPPRVAAFVREVAAGGPRRARFAIGNAGDAEVLAAFAPVTADWSIVLEQDAAVFDIELQDQPSIIVATLLTVVFGVVFLLLALFDLRRRRAHRRSEVTKNAFFSIAGHELRTPLTALKGFAEALSADWNDLDNKRRRTLADRMVPQTRRLDHLVERLLVAASIQAETHTQPDVREVDPLSALEQVVERFVPEAPLHTFEIEHAEDVAYVQADPQALDQVLGHLVENAIKYSPAGGLIRLRVAGGRRAVDLVVEDEGVGLPADRRHIFDKFVQGEAVTKRVHDEGGVGLGLYIVRTLVETMGGSVRAEPRDPQGARFVVSLQTGPTTARRRAVSLA